MEEIHYLIGNNCNLNCDFCFWDKRMLDVSLEFKKNIVDQIIKAGIKRVTLSGGEPTMTNNFVEIIKYMHSNGLEIILHTNGLEIDEGLAKNIAPYVSRVSLTLDGSNEEIISEMRGNKKLVNHTISLINVFKDLGVLVNVKTLVTKINQNNIIKIGELLMNLPIQYWSLLEFNPLHRGLTNKSKFLITSQRFDEITEKMEKEFMNLKIRVRKYSTETKKYCFITANGEIYTYIKNQGDVLMGNLEKDNLHEILLHL